MFKPLNAGDTVAVVAPANFIAQNVIDAISADITKRGYKPFIHPQCFAREGRFAGNDFARLQALHEVFANQDVKAIIAARGGYGCMRFIDQLDRDLIIRNPKPLVGYSDITTLLNALPIPALHGPMAIDLTRDHHPIDWSYLWDMLAGKAVSVFNHPAAQAVRILCEGSGEGVLKGGNLSLLAAECGTPTQLQAAGAILLLEDVGEDLYRFDRMLCQLKRAGVFNDLRGVIIGDLTGVEDKGEPAFGQSAEEILLSHFKPLGIPVVHHFPTGHGHSRISLWLNHPLALKAHPLNIQITQSPLA